MGLLRLVQPGAFGGRSEKPGDRRPTGVTYLGRYARIGWRGVAAAARLWRLAANACARPLRTHQPLCRALSASTGLRLPRYGHLQRHAGPALPPGPGPVAGVAHPVPPPAPACGAQRFSGINLQRGRGGEGGVERDGTGRDGPERLAPNDERRTDLKRFACPMT